MNTEKSDTKKDKYRSNKGFTLVELMVSISIFVLSMILVTGSVLSILNLNSRAQAQKTAMDNLNFALESMSRIIKFGTNYHCGVFPPLTAPNDCASGNSSLTVSTSTSPTSLVTYALSGGAITQSINGGAAYAITSPEVDIKSLSFKVFGSAPGDMFQPEVIITVSGVAGSANKASAQATFNLETTVSQRRLDI